jgi:glucose-6-phosphate isomerase
MNMNKIRVERKNEQGSVAVDLTYMDITPGDFERKKDLIARAVANMKALEAGAIANPTEGRQVGHYWLRNSALAPTPELDKSIAECLFNVKQFVADIREGKTRAPSNKVFTTAVVIGIGGSALGPQLVDDALGGSGLKIKFIDNTDPDGIARVLSSLVALDTTLFIVISKSGGTRETYNGEMYVKHVLKNAGLDAARQMVAITQVGSSLYSRVQKEEWLANFPMWDWVGGRTSVTSAVGLIPAGLGGVDIEALLSGAREMDEWTRIESVTENPALLMSLSWHLTGNGCGEKNMVVLPYCDRFLLLSRYLQQLVMESVGKKQDLNGSVVHQGLSVFGNKGSTDQHAFVQQLRDGSNDFFATFIEVLEDGGGVAATFEVEPGITMGDYLHGFLVGTREALREESRRSLTISVARADAYSLGALIALFERAVGFYASLVNVNAYDQPGVEAGKKAAESIIEVQRHILGVLSENRGNYFTLVQVYKGVTELVPTAQLDIVEKILVRFVANGRLDSDGVGRDPTYRML